MKRAHVLILVIGAFVLLAAWGPARAVGLWAVGRAGNCTLSRSVESARQAPALVRDYAERARSAKIVQRDEAAGLVRWQTGGRSYWAVASDDPHWLFLFLTEQDEDLYESPHTRVKPGDVVLDCGAHYGLFVAKALAMGARKVVAIEPAPQTLECLRRNLAAEIASGRVLVYPKGVWDKPGKLRLSIKEDEVGANSVLGQPGASGVEVDLTTIDAIVDELKLDRVDFIKMDIEGAERNALAGAAGTLRRFKPALSIAAYHRPDDYAAIRAAVFAAVPDYTYECGSCSFWGLRIRQDTAQFHHRSRTP